MPFALPPLPYDSLLLVESIRTTASFITAQAASLDDKQRARFEGAADALVAAVATFITNS